MTMKKPKAIIFDADGTLFDTFEMIVAAYAHVSETHGLKIPDSAKIRAKLGHPLHEMFRMFYPGEDIETLIQTNNEFVAANIMKSEAFEGVESLLKGLHEQNIKLGILTSGTANILSILQHHNMSEYFSSVVYTERIKHSKPHPEGFVLACIECGVQPRDAVMVGDTIFDIETGKNAGALATVAITHGFGNPQDLAAAMPDFTVNSIFELNEILSSTLG